MFVPVQIRGIDPNGTPEYKERWTEFYTKIFGGNPYNDKWGSIISQWFEDAFESGLGNGEESEAEKLYWDLSEAIEKAAKGNESDLSN